jgi:hypothetical protein
MSIESDIVKNGEVWVILGQARSDNVLRSLV